MGIVKPTSGKIIYDGQDITDFSVSDRAKMGISFAFQQPVKFKGLTVKDILSLALKKNQISIICVGFFLQWDYVEDSIYKDH